jgi:hypothetical protein
MPRRCVRVRSWVVSLLLMGAYTELIIRRAFARAFGYSALRTGVAPDWRELNRAPTM